MWTWTQVSEMQYLSRYRCLPEASAPNRGKTLASMPIRLDKPVLPHPGSLNSRQTKSDVDLGERTHSGTSMQKKP